MAYLIDRNAFLLCVACVAVCASSPDCAAQDDTNAPLAKVVHRLGEIEREYSVLEVHWTEQVTYCKGSIRSPEESEFVNPSRLYVPSTEITKEYKVSMYLDGEKMAYSRKGEIWAPETGEFAMQDYVSTFNGKVAKVFRPAGIRFSQGSVLKLNRNIDVPLYSIKPILMFCRFQSPHFNTLKLGNFRFSGIEGRIADKEYQIFEQKLSYGKQELWIDSKDTCMICRFTRFIDKTEVIRITISYLKESGLWRINAWDGVLFNMDGSPKEILKCTVTEFKVNHGLAPSVFEVSFPEGTWVKDEVAQNEYLELADNKRRPILKSELGAAYEEIRSSSPGMAGKQYRGPQLNWWVLVGLTLLLVGGITVYFRRRKARRV